jgi:ubiquitin carboxyl-terminal hydrolase L5
MSDWCTIESDPGVFTELLENVGVKGVELEELWTLDDESLAQLGPLFGLIFLFKWMPGQDTSLGERTPLTPDQTPSELFFAQQVTTNACATQAILSVVLNAPDVDLGDTLGAFKSFTTSFPPDLKGEAIGASTELQQAHNAFARKDAFLHEGKQMAAATGNEDVFHFVAYLPFGGKVYELDGLQSGPIVIGDADGDTPWYSVARTAIQQRMNASPEIKFNLMALVADRRILLEQQAASGADVAMELATQVAKREQWKSENERRRHNYVPLCVNLITELARQGKLPELIAQAGERVRAKQAKKKAASS